MKRTHARMYHREGHGSLTLIEKTYGHLLEVRQRLPVVEYRPLEVVREEARTA